MFSYGLKFLVPQSIVKVMLFSLGVNIGTWTGQSSATPQHDISGSVSFLDNTTILLENFNFDGNGLGMLTLKRSGRSRILRKITYGIIVNL